MKKLLAAAAILTAPHAFAAEIDSVYTDLADTNCITIAKAPESDGGDWANKVCTGYAGYPVLLDYGDARDSVFYGFPPTAENGRVWESFDAFNSVSEKVEWRVRKDGDVIVPFASIQRWSVASPEDDEKDIEVLVIERVGQPADGQGCTVGLVVATGNPQANETARRIADEQASYFACGADERTLVGEPMPTYSRHEN